MSVILPYRIITAFVLLCTFSTLCLHHSDDCVYKKFQQPAQHFAPGFTLVSE
jgi:hypothetical protein